MTERGTRERHWLVRLVKSFGHWEVARWTNPHGLRYETRKHKKTGKIEVRHKNFFHGDNKWHPLGDERSWEREDIERFYKFNSEDRRSSATTE